MSKFAVSSDSELKTETLSTFPGGEGHVSTHLRRLSRAHPLAGVWVGYIALYDVAVQTGVVMVVYLHEALDRRLKRGGEIMAQDIWNATVDGSILRLRPKLMTVTVVAMASLVPIMWSSGVGADLMKPIAAPIIGGMITSTIHVSIITPVIFYIMKLRALRKGTLTASRMAI
jgi:Cu(I)/Ag(I) efflux system membrane protein CusA/SilA